MRAGGVAYYSKFANGLTSLPGVSKSVLSSVVPDLLLTLSYDVVGTYLRPFIYES